MPIFDYKCNNCGDKFEELVLSKYDEPEKCPSCTDQKIEKLMSAPAALTFHSISNSSSECPCVEKQGTGFS